MNCYSNYPRWKLNGMPASTKFISESIAFADLFFKGRFIVPWHQRRYDWKKHHVTDLLRDIDDAMDNSSDFYFLGALSLINQGKDKLGINDGQQRMTTYSLICACFLKYFHSKGIERHDSLGRRILFDVAGRETINSEDIDKLESRMKLTREDHTQYSLMIQEKNVATNGLLTQAWEEIEKYVAAMSNDKAEKYFVFFTSKVEVSVLTIPSNVDPNMIFETLNFRGEPLNAFDLIRNHIYSYFNSIDQESRRDSVIESLEGKLRHQISNRNENKRIIEYTRCFLQCKFGFLPKTKLYRGVRTALQNQLKGNKDKKADYIFSLVEQLSNPIHAQIYNTITKQNTPQDLIQEIDAKAGRSKKSRNLKKFLDELRKYSITQPVLLALMSKYFAPEMGAQDKSKVARRIFKEIKFINAIVMRIVFVERKFESSHYESYLSDLARKVYSLNHIDELPDQYISDRLKEFSPATILKDTSFIETLAKIEFPPSTNEKAKRLLFSINAELQSDVEFAYSSTSLEHVLPKGESHWAGWSGFEEDRHAAYIFRLGNLSILGETDQGSTPEHNANWTAKRPVLERSSLKVNEHFSSLEEWNALLVDKRQELLAKEAARIWSLK